MRLLTWNILHGGGPRRVAEIALALVGHSPDVVVLTEFRPGRGGQLRGVLADHGLSHQLATSPSERANGILIASRHPVVRLDLEPPSRALAAKWLPAEIRAGDVVISVLGVHIPDDSRPTPKAQFWQRVVEVGKLWATRPAIIVGDLNTGRHLVDEAGSTFGCTKAMGELWTAGFRDAYRLCEPGGRATSWVSPEATGFRVDATWVSPCVVEHVCSASYSQAEREAKVSDHAILTVDFAGFGGNFDSGSENPVENSQNMLF